LLVSHIAGLPVPKTTVIPRYVPLFNFGTDTGSGNSWLRTSPAEPQPGQYTTVRGWIDPFRLLHDEDPSGEMLQSVAYQQEVKPVYSGALRPDRGDLVIEGVEGRGDEFMMSRRGSDKIPSHVVNAVERLYNDARQALGDVRLEWVFDGDRAWVVQLHRNV